MSEGAFLRLRMPFSNSRPNHTHQAWPVADRALHRAPGYHSVSPRALLVFASLSDTVESTDRWRPGLAGPLRPQGSILIIEGIGRSSIVPSVTPALNLCVLLSPC